MILNILRDQYSPVVNRVLFDACLVCTDMISCPAGPCAAVAVVRMRM